MFTVFGKIAWPCVGRVLNGNEVGLEVMIASQYSLSIINASQFRFCKVNSSELTSKLMNCCSVYVQESVFVATGRLEEVLEPKRRMKEQVACPSRTIERYFVFAVLCFYTAALVIANLWKNVLA